MRAVTLAKAEQFSQDDNCVTFEFGVTSWRHVTLGFEQRLRFAKIVSPLKTQSLANRVLTLDPLRRAETFISV